MDKINFTNFNEKGLSPITDALTQKHGQVIAKVDAPNMPKREDGFSVKTATITFESGQKLVLKIKGNGSIFQARINSKVVPIKHADISEAGELAKAIGEIAGYLKKNESTYLKQRRKRALKKEQGGTPAVSTSTKKQLADKKAELETVTVETEEIKVALAEIKGTVDVKMSDYSGIMAELEVENKTNETLRAELSELQEAA